jgi:hypothetical protein
MKNDYELQSDFQNATKWKPFLHAAEIGVIANDSVVSLTSLEHSYAKKKDAENAAKSGIGAKVSVPVTKVVSLTGRVNGWYQKKKLGQISWKTPSKWHVKDELLVVSSYSYI